MIRCCERGDVAIGAHGCMVSDDALTHLIQSQSDDLVVAVGELVNTPLPEDPSHLR